MGRAGYDCTGAAYGSHAHKATREIYRQLAGPTPRANTPAQGFVYAQDGCATPRASMMGTAATLPSSSHSVAAAAAQAFNMQNGIVGYGYKQQPQQHQLQQQLPQQQQQQQTMGFVQQAPSQGVYVQGNGVSYASAMPQGYTYAQPYQAMQGVNQASYCVGGVGVSGVAYSYPTPQGFHQGTTTRGPYY